MIDYKLFARDQFIYIRVCAHPGRDDSWSPSHGTVALVVFATCPVQRACARRQHSLFRSRSSAPSVFVVGFVIAVSPAPFLLLLSLSPLCGSALLSVRGHRCFVYSHCLFWLFSSPDRSLAFGLFHLLSFSDPHPTLHRCCGLSFFAFPPFRIAAQFFFVSVIVHL